MAEELAVNLAFWKMHGAGNDFILFDDRRLTFPAADIRWIRRLACRRTGIGCEGVILLQPSAAADVRMRFFNPDGSEADMCGNGIRCVARLAHELGAAPARMHIETGAGLLSAELLGENVRLGMTPPRDWRLDAALTALDTEVRYSFVNTGVPHAVVEVTDIDACRVAELGAALRRHAAFAPAGTNVNFAQVTGPHALRLRTYERGVEAETLACGTGITAAALIEARRGRVTPPVQVATGGGHTLAVDFRLTPTGAEQVTLLGPAEHVFRGTVPYVRLDA
jgi:diaminopimelate epimerase